MASKRRYAPIRDEERTYHETFDRLRLDSQILNAGGQAPSIYTILHDKGNLEAFKRELEGDSEGYYYRPDSRRHIHASIPAMKEALEEIDDDFKQHQQSIVNTGRAVPTELTPELKEKKLITEAKLDVYLEEAEVITEKLAKFTEVETKRSDGAVLERGPQGAGSLRDGLLNVIDGQDVSLMKKVLVIDDDRSPYDGMATADYFTHVVKPWCKERSKLRREQLALSKEKGKNTSYTPNARPPVPGWPERIKNHKKVKERVK